MAEMYCLMYIINILFPQFLLLVFLQTCAAGEYSFITQFMCSLHVARPVVYKNQRLPFIIFITEVPFHLVLSNPRRSNGDLSRVWLMGILTMMISIRTWSMMSRITRKLNIVHAIIMFDVLLHIDITKV